MYDVTAAQYGASSQITGTYLCRELVLSLATWVSIEFYDKCSKIITDHFIAEYQKQLVEKDSTIDRLERMHKETMDQLRSMGIQLTDLQDKNDELLDKVDDLQDKNDELLDKVDDLQDKNTQIQKKLNIAVVDRAPLPAAKSKQECFLLLKLNDDKHYPFYVIRAQRCTANMRLKIFRRDFPKLQVLLRLDCQGFAVRPLVGPNSKTLYARIRDELIQKGVTFCGNNIDDVSEKELVQAMKQIDSSKLKV